MKLVPCSGCQRHVRCDEAACPFCGVALSCGSSKVGPAAAVMLAAGLALTGCPDKPMPVPRYGAPPINNNSSATPPAPVQTATPTKPTPPSNPPIARYGAPPLPAKPANRPK